MFFFLDLGGLTLCRNRFRPKDPCEGGHRLQLRPDSHQQPGLRQLVTSQPARPCVEYAAFSFGSTLVIHIRRLGTVGGLLFSSAARALHTIRVSCSASATSPRRATSTLWASRSPFERTNLLRRSSVHLLRLGFRVQSRDFFHNFFHICMVTVGGAVSRSLAC